MNRESVVNIVRSIVQPLQRGAFDSVTGLKAKLKDLIPFGAAENFQVASPFGFISKPPGGVLAFFQNLFGNAQNPIVLSHLHKDRPEPSAAGETIIYCSSGGAETPVKITLLVDGTLKIEAKTKVQVHCDQIELGKESLEKVLNGETFQQYFNTHQHLGNLGAPTGPPITPSDATHLSSKVKAAK